MPDSMRSILETVRARGIRFVRFVWCDNAGVIRAKAVSGEELRRYLEGGVAIAAAQQALPAMYDALAPGAGLTPAGEVFLRADWSTFRPLPYTPGHARVLTDIYEGDRPWGHCPRGFLRRQIARAAERGLRLEAAFENEFYVLRPEADPPAPVDATVFAQTFALDRLAPALDAIAAALREQGIQPEMVHAESGPGQFEMPVRHAEALAAADQQVAVRETVRAVAAHHGLIASFLPKIFPDKAGSGAHLHFSLWREGRNLMADGAHPEAIAGEAGSFLAGILGHLPALTALTIPSPNSFKRIHPRFWSGAYVCWGYANREAAVRVPQPPPGRPVTNFELKTVDATCNPYLALGAVLAAGLDGLERGLAPGEPVSLDPADLSDGERASRGIRPLPTRLGDALAALEQDRVLLDALGPDLARSFTAVRRAEWEALKDAPHADEVRLLLDRY